ncbi:MAG: penicillin-binding protein [Gammaproteobacteria bacterium]|nr:penicillin-binding protein [Gammaproteobacteria bacterium]
MTEEQQVILAALKIAFAYMPKAIEVNQYDFGDRYPLVLQHVEAVRDVLRINGIDPDEVDGSITPNSSH